MKRIPMMTLLLVIASGCESGNGAPAPAEPEPRGEETAPETTTGAADETPDEGAEEQAGGNAFQDARRKSARLKVQVFAHEGYARWRVDTGEECPEDVGTLLEYVNARDARDPWGNQLIMLCDDAPAEAKGFGIVSVGPDGKRDTADDIRSWESPE